MKIVLIGGTGLIGSQMAKLLSEQHEVIAASPKTGVNTLTKEGLEKALEKADVVVDVSNSPSFADDDVMDFFKTSTSNIVAACKKAGVKHLIILSVVGTAQLQESGYFRAKQVQEDLIRASGLPYTIVQATQFFEFAGSIAYMCTVDGKVMLSNSLSQPIASIDVATFMSQTALQPPANATQEIGGPQEIALDQWISQYLKAVQKPMKVVTDSDALYSGAGLKERSLVPESPVFLGSIHYVNWIKEQENKS